MYDGDVGVLEAGQTAAKRQITELGHPQADDKHASQKPAASAHPRSAPVHPRTCLAHVPHHGSRFVMNPNCQPEVTLPYTDLGYSPLSDLRLATRRPLAVP